MNTVESVTTATKWATVVNHVKNNRVEYLVITAILHMAGLLDIVYTKASGVCM